MKVLAPKTAGSALAIELGIWVPLCRFRQIELHVLVADSCPNTMLEIGRIRESEFRAVGAGRGESRDIDPLDYGATSYRQLVAYDAERHELVAMLRFQFGDTANTSGDESLRTSSLFEYAELMRQDVLPNGIELGRSVVNKDAKRARLGLYALWVGLAALVNGVGTTGKSRPLKYLFGNISLFASYNAAARDRLVGLLEKIYAPPQATLVAHKEVRFMPAGGSSKDWHLAGNSVASRLRFLRDEVAAHGEVLPPILISYLSLGTDIWLGQSAYDADFGGAVEIGIVVPVVAISAEARKRFGIHAPAAACASSLTAAAPAP